MPAGPFGTRNPVTILLRGIKEILSHYDYILIDCPPNLGYITLNGLCIADGYMIPTIPDVMSTYGIPQIVTRISKFSDEISTEKVSGIMPIGIVATKVRLQAPIHRRTLNQLRNHSGKVMDGSNLVYPTTFDTEFLESASMAEAAEYLDDQKTTLRQKWGYGGQYNTFDAFAKEFMAVCEAI